MELRDVIEKYVEFLESKSRVKEKIQDIDKTVVGGRMTAQYIIVKETKSTPEYYIEFCKLHNLNSERLFGVGGKIDLEAYIRGD